MTIIEMIRAAEDEPSSVATSDLARLNAVTVTVGQLSAAQQALAQLSEELRWDAAARRAALNAELDESDISIDAIDARLQALQKWEDLHDPDRTFAQLHLMDAASLAPLLQTEHGIGFCDTTFRELVEFVAELPW